MDYTAYLSFAKSLARQGGRLIADNAQHALSIQIKSDRSPVTQIDKQINTLVFDAIRSSYPQHGLLGEEENYGSGVEELQWVCDPLDGTKPFILGIPTSVFILGLMKDGHMQLAVSYDPYSDKMYHAVRGQGAFCNDQPIHVNNDALDGGYMLLETSSFPYVPALYQAGALEEPVPGTGYKCLMIASGRGVGLIKGNADFHDVGPSSLIVEEAGGKVTGLDGQPLRYDQPLTGAIISNGKVHQELLQIVRSVQHATQ